jgi:processive 1,2-diacylglycerol beta-glucosyltransferase
MAGAFASLGGAPRVVETLSDCPHALQAVVIAGRDEELVEQLKTQVAGSKNPIHVYGFREDIPTFMAAADVLVTKAGGITTTEALAMHLPLIIYQPISGQEEANTRYLVENGAGIQANNLQELELALRELVSDPSRQRRMAGCAAKLGRPDAAELIAETVCKACLETQEVKTS